eukprot:jgi/Chrzof1/14000/Cz08g20210.t1
MVQLLGPGIVGKLATIVLVLSESTVPVYLLFGHQFSSLQNKLFDETLKARGVVIHSADPDERRFIQAQLAQQAAAARSKEQARPTPANLVSRAVGLAATILLRPKAKESKLIRTTRKLITLPLKVLVPQLALPYFALFVDGYVETSSLLSRYLDRKGIQDPKEQELIAQQHLADYRSFGFVASMLNYVPVLNWLLGLTNSVGGALWAADWEKKGGHLIVKPAAGYQSY